VTNYNNISSKFEKLFKEIRNNLKYKKNNFHILSKNFEINFSNKDLKKMSNFKSLAILGMGGSILGTEAIYQFLEKKIKKKVVFFNDLNEEKIVNFKKTNKFNKVLFVVVSKSGNTLETLSNFIALNIIKKHSKNIIIISEKKNNILRSLVKSYNLFYIEHKDYVGGRYSVLSEVGLVPAYLMGLDIKKLRSNLTRYLNTREKVLLKKLSLKLTNLLLNKKYSNIIFLNYSPRLEKFLFWAQQLLAESLGKKGLGFLPVVSNAPKDHHSLLQLYLDGPKNKFFYIFSCVEKPQKLINSKKLLNELKYLDKKSLNKVKNSQREALIKTFKKNKIQYEEFIIKKIDEKTLGELFSLFILKTAIVGKLSNINPFDQPAVEQVKIFTKQILR
tara:strand:- start:151 stop:1314 length:1164 start_codon:yes stop_codon:yes gene_type:complete